MDLLTGQFVLQKISNRLDIKLTFHFNHTPKRWDCFSRFHHFYVLSCVSGNNKSHSITEKINKIPFNPPEMSRIEKPPVILQPHFDLI